MVLIVVAIWTSLGTLTMIFVGGIVFLAIALAGISSEFSSSPIHTYILSGDDDAEHVVVSLPISGLIVGDDNDISDPFGLVTDSITQGYDVKETLKELAEDDEVSGVILDINSPGGTIYGANAIAEGVEYYRNTANKPILAYVSGLAASGGYWAAASADEIVADVGTTVGSIGIISGPFQYYDTVKSIDGGAFVGGIVTENGIETTYITAGKSKDMGNPFRKLTSDELENLQTMVNNEYDGFVSFVSRRRTISEEILRNTIGALTFDTKSALGLDLIDRVGSRDMVYDRMAERIGVSVEDLQIIRLETSPSFLKTLLESRTLQPTTSESPLCSLTNVHLVYHGDVTKFCQ